MGQIERRCNMLTIDEIKQIISDDSTSTKKRKAIKGQKYYNAEHDIKNYKLYYYNADGELIEDTTRSNIKISHAFFTELVDQAVQYILSGKDGFIKSDIPELQAEMDRYFNEDEDFIAELSEVLTGSQSKGFEYMYAYKNADNRTAFQCADSIGVIEVKDDSIDSVTKHIVYWYMDTIDRGRKEIKRIQVWDDKQVEYYVQENSGDIQKDSSVLQNPRPHTILKKTEDDNKTYFDTFGFIPFFRLDNNKKQESSLKPIKELIDDYDLMACGLSNNLQDASEYLVVVAGFQGNDLEELITNTKVKKHIGIDEGGMVDFKTVDIPYQARQAKLDLDEKSIYKFGFGLNTSGLKDTNATTNIAIKSAYALLDLKCSKIEIRLKQFLRKLVKVVLKEINDNNETDYKLKDVYFNFGHEVMSNAEENARIELTKEQTRQTAIATLLSIAAQLDNDTLMQLICEQLDIDYEEIKDKLPDPKEAETEITKTQAELDSVATEEV